MSLPVWIALGLLVAGMLLYRFFRPSLDTLAQRVIKTRDLGPLIAAIGRKPKATQPAAYHHAIRRLWEDYDRELAVDLIGELAREFPRERIAQYWLGQAQQVEPKLAQERLGREFLAAHFLPDLAAQCGPAG